MSSLTDRQATVDGRRDRRRERFSSPSLTHSMLYSIGSSGGTLVLQLLTGVLTARLLGSVGRGEIEAVMSWVNLSAIVFAFGFASGLSFSQAKCDGPSASLFSAGLVSVVVFGAVAVGVTESLIPLGFAEQRDEIVRLARVAMFGTVAVMGTNMVRTLQASNDFFRPMSLNTIGQPFLYAVGACILWLTDSYGVGAVVGVQIASFAMVFLSGSAVLWSVSGVARPQQREVAGGLSYGLRSYPSTLSRLANARLDVVLLPAFVSADDIGQYVVAVSVGSMMVALFQQLNRVMFTSVAKASPLDRTALIERLVRVVGSGVIAVATVLAIVGPSLITVVYGADFSGSATPLRILLPGLAFWACGNVMSGALSGVGRPGRASIAQLVGVAVTLVGLALLLRPLGITGAAIVSTLSYTSVALVTGVYLRRSTGMSFRRIFSVGAAWSDMRSIAARAHGRMRRRHTR